MDGGSHDMVGNDEGENLVLRKTQGELLQKLRQLRQWQQQQQEHLLQDKEKKLSIIKEQEKKLQAVQDYQRRILNQSGYFGSSPNVNGTAVGLPSNLHMQTNGFQEIPAVRQGLQQGRLDSNSNAMPVNNFPSAGLMWQPKMVLLSPKHFQTTVSQIGDDLDAMNSPENTRPHNPMLLTQKIHLPVRSDEELSQFTESDGSSISDIDGLRPIEDTSSEASLDDNVGSGSHPLNELNDDDDYEEVETDSDKDDTLVEKERKDKQTRANTEDHMMDANPSFDDVPVKSVLGSQTKTFEELLDEQLNVQNPEEPLRENEHEVKVAVKRSFLRKGQGIARFGYTGKKQSVQKTQIIERKSNKKDDEKGVITRKIASNKQSSSIIQGNIHQGLHQNTSESKLSYGAVGHHSTDITEDARMEELCDNEGVEELVEERIGTSLAPVIEDSFQERMKKWDEIDIVEKQELNEFELLEEAAANCSLSSNSSTVMRILGKKKTHLDRNNNPTTSRPDWRESVIDEIENIDLGNDVNNNTLTDDTSVDEEDTLKAGDTIPECFDDTKSWDDHSVFDSSDVPDDPLLSLNTSTPEGKRKLSRVLHGKSPQASSTPPTSALVTKLFPQLKPKSNEDVKVSPKQSASHEPSVIVSGNVTDSRNSRNEHVMSSAVREKLQELEKEIEKFREENATLHRLREEREKVLQELQREKSLFENQKSEELERLEKFKTEEERRLRRDKRIFEQYQKASRALPDKKEREEIATLKARINELQEDMKLRESRWSAAATRHKDKIVQLEKENKETKEEVKLLEKQNLELQRKDQQKTHELQQLKAFEKRKIAKPEELQAKLALTRGPSQPSNAKEERFIEENKEQKSPLNTPSVDQQRSQKQVNFPNKVNSDKCASRVPQKDLSSPAEMNVHPYPTKEHLSPKDTQRLEKTPTNATYNVDKESSSVLSLNETSPPSEKKTNSSKSVRFKDDDTREESQPQLLPKEICHDDGKREVINADGSRVVTFSNGTRKEISADEVSVIVTFFNGDVKQVMPDKSVVYYYAEAQTTHTTYPDGMQVLQFPSNQVEKHYPDGTKEIIFPDQTVKYLYESGDEECVFADGTVERVSGDGSRTVEFPNGQKETFTKLYKKREYPDGTVKTVYTDGRQETRYPSGRLRVKDGEGRLLVDTADDKETTIS